LARTGGKGGEAVGKESWETAYGEAPVASRLRVAFQGIPGAYGEEAADRYMAQVGRPYETVAYPTFAAAAQAVAQGQADLAVLPTENSYAGSVPEVHDALARLPQLHVVGEVVHPVHHCLVAAKGVTLDRIRRVLSHPQALQQCGPFLEARGMEALAAPNTAWAAREVARRQEGDLAAIASAQAARRYGLSILARNVEAVHHNATRFLIVAREARPPLHGPVKVSLLLWLRHVPGALAGALNALAQEGVNLTRIESRPAVSRPWEYVFLLDFTAQAPQADKALAALRGRVEEMRVLGIYRPHPSRGEEGS
jgi:prephenate dehydratase